MEKESVKVLLECVELQNKKANDYQNPNSRIKQSDYYPRGLHTISDICWAKILRIYSVLEAMDNDINYSPNFESLEDSFKDLINYCSFAVAWIRGKIDGQQSNNCNNNYTLISSFKNNELPIVLNYLIENNYQYRITNNEVFVDTTNLDLEGYKILCQNLIIILKNAEF